MSDDELEKLAAGNDSHLGLKVPKTFARWVLVIDNLCALSSERALCV